MSTLTSRSPVRVDPVRPGLAAALGAATFVAAMVSGEVFDLNADTGAMDTSAGELAVYAALILVAAAAGTWVAARALAGPPARLGVTALCLSVASLVTVLAFWSGWPHILGAVAAFLAVEHRRRVGSFSAGVLVSLVLAVVAFLGATYLCLFG